MRLGALAAHGHAPMAGTLPCLGHFSVVVVLAKRKKNKLQFFFVVVVVCYQTAHTHVSLRPAQMGWGRSVAFVMGPEKRLAAAARNPPMRHWVPRTDVQFPPWAKETPGFPQNGTHGDFPACGTAAPPQPKPCSSDSGNSQKPLAKKVTFEAGIVPSRGHGM